MISTDFGWSWDGLEWFWADFEVLFSGWLRGGDFEVDLSCLNHVEVLRLYACAVKRVYANLLFL